MKFYPEGHLIDKAENKASMQTPAASPTQCATERS